MLREGNRRWKHPVLLGVGAFSEVYREIDAYTGEFLVCKESRKIQLAEREAELLKRVRHPLFPKYKGEIVCGDKHCLMMEYICGQQLRKYVEKRGGLSQKRAVQIAVELAKGLVYLHELPETVIFRDIKPENVLIQLDGKVRLVDLGCAHVEGSGVYSLAGSRGYAAPEQLQSGGRVGMESDVYALGKLLCFMLTGQDGSSLLPKGLSRGLRSLISQALQDNPRLRIPDMRTFLCCLESYEEKKLFKTLRHRKKEATFHYYKNIRKGL